MARFDLSSLLAAGDRLRAVASRLPQIQQRAVGTLGRRLPVETRRDIQAEYNLSASRLLAGLIVRRLPNGVEITGSRRPIGLRHFGRRMARGFQVRVFKREAPELLRHAFLQTPTNDFGDLARTGEQLYERVMEGGKPVWRTPIRRLHGPSLADMLGRGDRPARLAALAQNILAAEIRRLVGVA